MSLGCVFPGQGSQSLGMLNGFKHNLIVKKTIEEASDILKVDFFKLIFGDDIEELNLTINTQPVVLSVSIALWRVYCDKSGPMPILMAGHSLGEYSALTASGVMKFDQALKLVRFRASAMQKAVPEGVGSMAAIMGISGEDVKKICDNCSIPGHSVEPANYNSNDQTVVSGSNEIIDKVCIEAKNSGARRVVKLAVSAPFHSSLMAPAAHKLKNRLKEEEFSLPTIPVINNVDVKNLKSTAQIKVSLADQAMSSVRWYETIQKFNDNGIKIIVECGPGKVLSGLTKRINPNIQSHSFTNEKVINEVISILASK